MCAIAGILDLPLNTNFIDEMIQTMRRRGPDAADFFQKGSCALLHARLAVIDPQGGSQPMTWCRGDETFTIVYNGELYNTPQLRDELIKCGHTFKGQSDTEVLLHAYGEWGEDCLKKCNGIFAFGVWEHREERLFLARDRIGVKPLFYKLHEGGFLFASEIKTILRYPTVKAQLDAQGAGEILLLGPGRTPGSGVFRGILELEPGCCGYYARGRFQWKRYWSLKDREHTENFEQTADRVRELVLDAIRSQMVSDVPIGTFLSGGLDSSLITSICAGEMEKHGKKLSTFSVDYENNEKYFVANKFQPNADGYYIRKMQEVLGTDHHWCVLTPEDLVAVLEEGVAARDLPGMADVDLSLLAFCRMMKNHVTVALSGECADEIFGGYPWYRDPEVRSREGFPWAQNTCQRCQLMTPELAAQLDGESFVRARYEKTCNDSDILPGTSPEERRMKEMVNLNFNWFMQTLLDRKDRMSMYSGLEVRVPFCDYRIAEYLYGVPWEYKNYQGKEKGLLRYAMRDYLPEEVLWRKKSPYPKTWDPRYLNMVESRLSALMKDDNAPLFRLVSRSGIEKMFAEESPWPWYGQLMRKPQTICYLLQINAWLDMYQVEILY